MVQSRSLQAALAMTVARQVDSWPMERQGLQMSAGSSLTEPLFRSSNSCCPSNSSEAMLQADLISRSTDSNQSCRPHVN